MMSAYLFKLILLILYWTMIPQLSELGVALILFGVVSIILGFIMLGRVSEVEGKERKSYAVFLIGPLPIIIKGGIKLAMITLIVVLLVMLLVFVILGGMIEI